MNDYKFPFNSVYTHALDLFGVEIDPNIFEEVAITAWDKIGNRQYGLYKLSETPIQVDKNTWSIQLPCNADEIEAVTASYEDIQKTSNIRDYPDLHNAYIEEYIESWKYNTNPLYQSGKFIKYRKENNELLFDYYFPVVNVLYKGYIADDEGLPFLTEKEVHAIAVYCAYIHDLKSARVSRDRASMEMAMYMEQKWNKACMQARIPKYINQNEMDEILNVANSWDRKRFGKSFKPIR